MATTDVYGQGVLIASLTDPPDAETLARNIANTIAGRSVLRFDSASARTAALSGEAAPVEGMVSWLRDVNRVFVYDGSAWQALAPQQQSGTANLSFTGLDQYSAPAISFPAPFTATPRVFLNIHSGVGATARWDARAINITATGFTPFVYASVEGIKATWSGIAVQWYAVAP